MHRPDLLRSCGKPYPWVEVRIVDKNGADVPHGTVGELWTRSPQNMLGYWNNPEATAATVTPDGWLKTGDAGYLDDEGYVYLHDRMKDMIVSGGENVYPAEVENVLMTHPRSATWPSSASPTRGGVRRSRPSWCPRPERRPARPT